MSHDSLDSLSTTFSPATRTRGAQYLRQGRVRLTQLETNSITATVRGTRYYRAVLKREHEDAPWDISCTCPAFTDIGPCKHLYAVLLAVRGGPSRVRTVEKIRRALMGSESDDGDVRAGNSRSGDEGAMDALPPELQRLLRRAGFVAQAGSQRSDVQRPVAPPERARAHRAPPESWRRQLDELRSSTIEVRPSVRTDQRLVYVLPAEHSPGYVRAELQLMSQRRYKRGGWSSPRPFVLDHRVDDEELHEDDRRILAMLRGARSSGYGSYSSGGSSYELPHALHALLLPLAARSGRLFLLLESGIAKEPLQWDAGGPWQFGLQLSTDDQTKHTALTAFLERGAAQLDLSYPRVVFAGGIFATDQHLAEIDWRGAWSVVPTLRRQGALRVPAAHTSEIVRLVCELPGDPKLDAPGLVRTVGGTPKPHLHLAAPGLDLSRGTAIGARIEFAYDTQRVPCSSSERLRPDGDALLRIVRDEALEQAALDAFQVSGGIVHRPPRGGYDASVPVRALPALVEALCASGWEIEADGRPVRSAGSLSLRVRSGIDWFDLEGEVSFGDAVTDLPELLRAARSGQRFVRLSDGSHGVLPEKWLAGWELALAAGDQRKGGLRFAKTRVWLLDAMLAEREVDADRAFAQARSKWKQFERIEALREPEDFRGELRTYQREGLGWLAFLRDLGFGGCLADDMGLGKTVQVLALLLDRASKRKGPTLVVAPKSVVFNWVHEARRFAPRLRVLEHTGTQRARDATALAGHDVVVTTYGTLRRDVELLSEIRFDYCILDESQAIKNAASQSAKAARLVRAEHRLALSGTPVENHLGELASLFEFLNPGLLGGARGLRDMLASGTDLESARHLASALRPFFLRRTKEGVLTELPEKSEQVVACELEGSERREYDKLREHYRGALLARADAEGVERIAMHVLEALLRLRQAACHPGLIDPERASERSAKLDALMSMLDEVQGSGHKALVFSQFTSFLSIVRRRLDAAGRTYEYLDGRTRKREDKVRRFQEDAGCPLFLISLKAGGFGLNLTAADYIFVLDPWWNPAVERQAIDRAHRIGQTRPVHAYRMVARDTIEEKVLELQQRKRALAEALFDENRTTLRDITRADLDWLLT
jgi:superfamily II DNA or RNA helicase